MSLNNLSYLDTSALIAFLDKSDTYNNLFKKLFSSPQKLVTSSLIIAEGHGWFLRRYDSNRAILFLNFISELPFLKIIDFGKDEIIASDIIIKKFRDQQLTLADAHSLVIMQEKKIKTCWSTDRHLTLTGAKLVIY